MLSLLLDVVLVLVFAAVGRRNHAEGLTAGGVLATAWPFLAGLVAGWLLCRAWRSPARWWPTGVGVWVATVAVGMLLRRASDEGTATSFVVVASVVLAVLLLGWRGLAGLAAGRNRT